MTRKEAKEILSRPFDMKNVPQDILDAHRMAVKALSAEPCEDAISRKWLKNAIHNFYKGLIHTPTEEDIQAYIDVAPSVKPQPKMGQWIKKDGWDGEVDYDCSICGDGWTTIDGEPWNNGMNYCPNCGAKMQEVKE